MKDGSTKAEALKNKTTNFFAPVSDRLEAEAELRVPDLADSLRYLLVMFEDAQRFRLGNGFTLLPLDIDKWAERRGYELEEWERDVLEELDRLVLRHASTKVKDEAEAHEKKRTH